MDATFEFQSREGSLSRLGNALGLHRKGNVLVAAKVGLDRVDDLGSPAAPFGVTQIHAQQVSGEQG